MITGDDLRRLEEEEAKSSKKLIVIETQQFFEIEIPKDLDPETYLLTDECKRKCADKILSGTTDLIVEDILYWDQTKEEWNDE